MTNRLDAIEKALAGLDGRRSTDRALITTTDRAVEVCEDLVRWLVGEVRRLHVKLDADHR